MHENPNTLSVVCGIQLFRCVEHEIEFFAQLDLIQCLHVKTVALVSLTALPTLVRNHTLRIVNIIQH